MGVTNTIDVDPTIHSLSRSFLTQYPLKSVKYFETLAPQEITSLLESHPVEVTIGLWEFIAPGISDAVFSRFNLDFADQLICQLDSHVAVALLSRASAELQQSLLQRIGAHSQSLEKELRDLMSYPPNTAAKLMVTRVQAFHENSSVKEVLHQLKKHLKKPHNTLFILNDAQKVVGEITLADLIKSSGQSTLSSIARPVTVTLNAMESKDEVIEKFEGYKCDAIPVLDAHDQLIGLVRFFDVYESTKIDLASDMQTMVGVSKDEQALSSSWFAVKKRLPWLQINLLTAFAAAAVVGAFEGLISQVTALAILLPVAAGQSGNAGAQALAVTMRGLTLREITIRHWPKVLFKEVGAGMLNGIAIAATCSLGVYVWSQSVGLALVIALSMVASLIIACSAGAVVPILLKRFGLDPAQSSSIVLTTITDIAGFMSFLGIAMLFSSMLPKG